MKNTILYKRSNQIGKVPTVNDLQSGELAVNTADGALYLNNATISTPVGTIQAGYLSNDSDWLLCDGSKYLKSQYPALADYLKYEISFINDNIPNPLSNEAIPTFFGSGRNDDVMLIGAYSGTIYVSYDYINWITPSLPTTGRWTQIVWNGSIFFTAASNANRYMFSSNGINWTAGNFPPASWIAALTWNGEIFCATRSNSNEVFVSNDGINWNVYTHSVARRWNTASSFNNLILLFEDQATCFYDTSIDGINWTSYQLPLNFRGYTAGGVGQAIVFNNKIYISGGFGAGVSDDSINWTKITGMRGSFYVPPTGSILYFFASNGDIFYSTDGSQWRPMFNTSGYYSAPAIGLNNILHIGQVLLRLDLNTEYFSIPKLAYINSIPQYIKI